MTEHIICRCSNCGGLDNIADHIICGCEDCSLNELLALAKTPPSPDELFEQTLSDVKRFILAKNIKEGDKKIPVYQIYFMYVDWFRSLHAWKKPLSIRNFGRELMKVMGHCRKVLRLGTFYMLEPAPFEISQEEHWTLRKRVRREMGKESKHTSRL